MIIAIMVTLVSTCAFWAWWGSWGTLAKIDAGNGYTLNIWWESKWELVDHAVYFSVADEESVVHRTTYVTSGIGRDYRLRTLEASNGRLVCVYDDNPYDGPTIWFLVDRSSSRVWSESSSYDSLDRKNADYWISEFAILEQEHPQLPS